MMRDSELQTLIDERDYLKMQLAEITGSNLNRVSGLYPAESRIVRALSNAKGKVLSIDALLNVLHWDCINGEERERNIVTVCISRIRKKRPDLTIETVIKEGYRMDPAINIDEDDSYDEDDFLW